MNQPICRISGQPLTKVLDFGQQPLGNGFLPPEHFISEYFYPMEMGFSEKSMMLQLIEQPAPEKMFHEHYAFYSSTSRFMERHFGEFSHQVMQSKYLAKADPFVVELGCNDGIMLKHFAQASIRHLGIEPSRNVAEVANVNGVRTLSEFFNENVAEQIVREEGQADAFLAANVMCHIPDIQGVVKGIRTLLKPTGVVMFEDPYLGDVIEKTSYDQIYDAHIFIFSLHSVRSIFNIHGLELIDALPQKTHGGSMRYVIAKKGCRNISNRVGRLIKKEIKLKLNKISSCLTFKKNCEISKKNFRAKIFNLKKKGKTICGYAASAKSTTALNYCKIDSKYIDYIVDSTKEKINKFSPGTHIPIVDVNHFRKNYTDIAILCSWNHRKEIQKKEQNFSLKGGRWISHVK